MLHVPTRASSPSPAAVPDGSSGNSAYTLTRATPVEDLRWIESRAPQGLSYASILDDLGAWRIDAPHRDGTVRLRFGRTGSLTKDAGRFRSASEAMVAAQVFADPPSPIHAASVFDRLEMRPEVDGSFRREIVWNIRRKAFLVFSRSPNKGAMLAFEQSTDLDQGPIATLTLSLLGEEFRPPGDVEATEMAALAEIARLRLAKGPSRHGRHTTRDEFEDWLTLRKSKPTA